ncbi:MAG: hypothetical protein QUV05_01800 [Phycisphaerae bacterium]|nr:hypothetical protein [Phycisphaerae bacterium]
MSMKKDSVCPQCGSRNVMLGVKLDDRAGGAGARWDATLSVEQNPDAIFFKEATTVDLKACVCAQCGHVEPYVANPSQLWTAYQTARSEQRR